MTAPGQLVIQQTKNWVKEVVIGMNLCPFAASVFEENSIQYTVINDGGTADSMMMHLQYLADSFTELDNTDNYETSLLIYPDAYRQFDDYLDFLDIANQLLEELNYSGIYQLASFHPDYRFAGSSEDDAGNYTNRSPYPMLHLLRERSIEKAVASYPDIGQVPENNINKLRDIGYQEMRNKLAKFTV